MIRRGLWLSMMTVLLPFVGRAAEPMVSKVGVVGNLRVEEEAIRVRLRTQAGQPFDRETLDKDIRAVYGMGFFDQVDADVVAAGTGRVDVTFHVKERPFVRSVKVTGASEVKPEEVEAALRIRAHTIFDPSRARQGIEAARKVYADKGFLDVDITYETTPVGDNEIDLAYAVDEKKPVRIQDIEFEGNEAFSDRKLRGLMQTSEEWILTVFTGAGNLNKDVLRADMERLTAWYYDNGYVTVRIDEPRIERDEDGLKVIVKIDEGPQFTVADVRFEGKDLPEDRAGLVKGMETEPGEVFRASGLREDAQRLNERLSDDGYAFATVDPQTEIDPELKQVHVTFMVDRGKPVMVDRIEISGNTKTRDQVIRREMRVQEQEPYSGTAVRRSREALQRLGFFKEVNITTRRPPGQDDRLNVVIDVKEGQTGSFSAGAGFSSADSLLFNVRVQENNLFGRGQRLILNADVGSIRRNIILSFTEPYFRETPLTVGVDAFSWRLDFDDFSRGGTGGGVNLSYPVAAWGYTSLWGLPLDEVRVGAAYRAEQAEISDLDSSASRSIRAEEGTSFISSITPSISRNTLNHAFDPTAGSMQTVSVEFAGLGGEQFIKAEARERFYYTFLHSKSLGDFTYSLGANIGWGWGDSGLDGRSLPLFERYFPGGINSIRGFKPRTLGPRESTFDRFGNEIANDPIGGSQQIILNNEIIFPIVQAIGLKGVVFVDAGNAYGYPQGAPSLDETRYSVGAGVRWLSPLGPLRVELAEPFNTKPHDRTSLIQFSFGGPFQF